MMEVLVGKRLESRSFNQHLEQLLKSDDNAENADDSKEHVENIEHKKIDEKEESVGEDVKDELKDEPCDLRIQKSQIRSPSSSSTLDTDNLSGEDVSQNVQRLLGKSDHEEGSSCSACDLLTSLDYLRRHRLLCDVMFQVQSNTFYAHRAVMASCSEMYRERYLEEIRNNNQKQMDVLEIEEVPPKIFQQVLDFVYTGKTEINDDVVQSLSNAAGILKINSLAQKCSQYTRSRSFCDKTSNLSTSSVEESGSENGVYQPPPNSRRSSRESLQAHSKPHEHIACQEQPEMKKAHSQHDVVLSPPTLFKPMPHQAVTEPHQYSSSLSRNPSISRSSAEGSSTSTNDQVFGHGFVNPANLESLKLNESSIQEWLSDPKLDERLRSFRYFNAPSLQRERPVKENVWSSILRNRMLANDLFRYGCTPFYNGALSYAGQNAAAHKLRVPNTAFSPYLPFPSSQGSENPFKRNLSNLNYKRDTNHSRRVFETLKCSRSREAASEDKHMASLNKTSNCNYTPPKPRRAFSVDEKRKTPEFSSISTQKPNKQDDATKPYNCPLCDAHFNRPANLKTHMRIHSGEKPYKCETCGARFVQVAHLRAHVLIHTGEKPYPCNVCGTSFRHLQTLKSHLRIHTGEKPYSCEKCMVQFRHKSQLRLHLRTKHGVQTNTKKTYKQVPGLRSADISAHIKRAQEAAKSCSSVKAITSPGFTQNTLESISSSFMEAPVDLHKPQQSSTNGDATNFSSNYETEDPTHSKYKMNVKAHFAKLVDVEDLTNEDNQDNVQMDNSIAAKED